MLFELQYLIEEAKEHPHTSISVTSAKVIPDFHCTYLPTYQQAINVFTHASKQGPTPRGISYAFVLTNE
jgi:hypothetical protein